MLTTIGGDFAAADHVRNRRYCVEPSNIDLLGDLNRAIDLDAGRLGKSDRAGPLLLNNHPITVPGEIFRVSATESASPARIS